MLTADGDVGSVAEIIGHADPQMTLKAYQETTFRSSGDGGPGSAEGGADER